MIVTVLSWIWIGVASFVSGFGVLEGLFRGKEGKKYSLEMYILAGLCVLTVYAQTFSLFYKVELVATVILAVACLGTIVCLRGKLVNYVTDVCKKIRLYKVAIVALIVGCVVILAAQTPIHYDTDLYHAQSIRWIEEYGIVKGLGNLYNRLAYNSAFFSLQALFSLRFALGRSLHSVNGFFVAIMLCYSILTLKVIKEKRLVVSDLFKLGLIFYMSSASVQWVISSPGSDILALGMVLYLGAKWSEYREQNQNDIMNYGVLCLLAVWACTIKLSAAMLVLLAIYPAVELIRKKAWKQIALFVGAGIVILLPFLIRNIFISGYLIYPYATIDIFDVDWKMAESVVRDDQLEIAAWGRGMTSREMYEAPASVWLPVWFANLSVGYRILVGVNVLCTVCAVIYQLMKTIRCVKCGKRIDLQELSLYITSLTNLLFWFVSSPLMRYGEVYLLLMPVLLAGALMEYLHERLQTHASDTLGCFCFQSGCLGVAVLVLVISFVKYYEKDVYYGLEPQLMPADYFLREGMVYQMDDVTIYIPLGSDQPGYNNFPGTPNSERAQIAELRTGRLEDGFRLKEEFRGARINTSGTVFWP